MSHRAPKSGNRLAADDVRIHAQPQKKRQPKHKHKPAPKETAGSQPKQPPPVDKDLSASTEILQLFARTFGETLADPALPQRLQEVKTHLYNRDYVGTFATAENLSAYVARWSPSRALCYRHVFLGLCDQLRAVFDLHDHDHDQGGDGGAREVVCVGGGAGGEVVAAAAAVRALLAQSGSGSGGDKGGGDGGGGGGGDHAGCGRLRITAVDVADWGTQFAQLRHAILGSSEHDAAAGAAAAAAVGSGWFAGNTPAGLFDAEFRQQDVLAADLGALLAGARRTRLVTLLFTTNELYAQSRAATTAMLLALAVHVPRGCLLLVLESAGSYSTVRVGDRLFGAAMLLDHTLLRASGDWELLVADDARWFRLPGGLAYPLALENMRYLVRLFRRL